MSNDTQVTEQIMNILELHKFHNEDPASDFCSLCGKNRWGHDEHKVKALETLFRTTAHKAVSKAIKAKDKEVAQDIHAWYIGELTIFDMRAKYTEKVKKAGAHE